MNYLAHLALSPNDSELQAGNFLGDFVKGREEQLRENYPTALVDGIMMHRAIDLATDAHPAFRHSRSLLHPKRRRFAGILVDIIYDHFLTIHWDDFFDTPIEVFVERVYSHFQEHPEWLVGELKDIFPYIKSENWLLKYREMSDLNHTFKRLSKRCRFENTMHETLDDLLSNYENFRTDFKDIFPDLQKVAREFQQL